jgi:hypothetical protein
MPLKPIWKHLKHRKGLYLKLFPRQKEIIVAYRKYRFNLVTKPKASWCVNSHRCIYVNKVGFAIR